ncbi:MAG: hypothetical protein SPJ12_07985, partial [Duodenibacillus sp.]|nr:hypothetical protein [Duodenibacillus sp.]
MHDRGPLLFSWKNFKAFSVSLCLFQTPATAKTRASICARHTRNDTGGLALDSPSTPSSACRTLFRQQLAKAQIFAPENKEFARESVAKRPYRTPLDTHQNTRRCTMADEMWQTHPSTLKTAMSASRILRFVLTVVVVLALAFAAAVAALF